MCTTLMAVDSVVIPFWCQDVLLLLHTLWTSAVWQESISQTILSPTIPTNWFGFLGQWEISQETSLVHGMKYKKTTSIAENGWYGSHYDYPDACSVSIHCNIAHMEETERPKKIPQSYLASLLHMIKLNFAWNENKHNVSISLSQQTFVTNKGH